MWSETEPVFNVVVTRFLVRAVTFTPASSKHTRSNVCGRRVTLATTQAERTPQDVVSYLRECNKLDTSEST